MVPTRKSEGTPSRVPLVLAPVNDVCVQNRDEIILGIPMGMGIARLVYWEWELRWEWLDGNGWE